MSERIQAYYNEIEPYCCDWLSNLMDAGLIMPGRIDDRSIHDVSPDDLAGFRRAHFFAGIGGWELALHLAEWPEAAEVWTGSCPCQPFSAAGKRKGTDDERHLWPEFQRLIAERRPAICFGEQVASADGRRWLTGVRADLEALGYGVGAADLCAAGTGAPHIRQRLWWVADAGDAECGRRHKSEWKRRSQVHIANGGAIGCMADAGEGRRGEGERHLREEGRQSDIGGHCQTGRLGLAASERDRTPTDAGSDCTGEGEGRQRGAGGSSSLGGVADADEPQLRGQPPAREQSKHEQNSWSDCSIIPCLDGKSRRIESGSFPLVAGIPRDMGSVLAALRTMEPDSKAAKRIVAVARGNRTGRLKGYGNAIVPQVAAEFIQAFMESIT